MLTVFDYQRLFDTLMTNMHKFKYMGERHEDARRLGLLGQGHVLCALRQLGTWHDCGRSVRIRMVQQVRYITRYSKGQVQGHEEGLPDEVVPNTQQVKGRARWQGRNVSCKVK